MKDDWKIEDQYDLDEEERIMVQLARLLFRLAKGEDYLSKEMTSIFLDKSNGLKYRDKKLMLEIGGTILKSAATLYYVRSKLREIVIDPKVDN